MRGLAAVLLVLVSFTARAGGVPPALSAYQGKFVYLDFWASWCTPCAQSFPWLNAMRERYGDRIEIVGVNVDARDTDMQRFLVRHPADFAILRDPQGALAEHYSIEGMPATVILDPEGRVVHRHAGFRTAETPAYEASIRAALEPSSDRRVK